MTGRIVRNAGRKQVGTGVIRDVNAILLAKLGLDGISIVLGVSTV